MKKEIFLMLIVLVMFLFIGQLCSAQSDDPILEIPRYPVDLEGIIQDAGGYPLDNVTLHVRTEYLSGLTGKAERKYYNFNVNSNFHVQFTPGTFSMALYAEKEGYALSSEYSFSAEELSAKDVVIKLISAVRQSMLDTGLGRAGINEVGKAYGYSFERQHEIPLDQTPDPADIYVYLEVKGEPTSYQDTDTYSVALVGVGVEFREAFLLPSLKYMTAYQQFDDELLQAPEDGYVPRIEANNPNSLANRYFYFKTRDGQYGKLRIEKHRVYVSNDELMVKVEYYFQPDGTRDLAPKVALAPVPPSDITPPVTTDNYQYNGVWTNQDTNITLTATDDISGVARTYYRVNSGTQQEGTNIIVTAEGQHSVSYWSVDTIGNTESPKAIGIWIDKIPPVSTASLSITPNEAGWINKLPVTVSFKAVDPQSADGSSGSGIFAITSDKVLEVERVHNISYYSTDVAGNVEAEKTITVNVDTTPPDVTISAEPFILWPPNKKPVQVTIRGSATDALSGVSSKTFRVTDEYSEVNAALTDFGQVIELIPWRTGDDKDGRIYTIKAVVTDKAGNSIAKETTVTVPHDMG